MIIEIASIIIFSIAVGSVIQYVYKSYTKLQNERLLHAQKSLSLIGKIAEENDLSEELFGRLNFFIESIDDDRSPILLLKALSKITDNPLNNGFKNPIEDLPDNVIEEWREAFWHWMWAVAMISPFKFFLLQALIRNVLSPRSGSAVETAVKDTFFRSQMAS